MYTAQVVRVVVVVYKFERRVSLEKGAQLGDMRKSVMKHVIVY